MNKSVFIRSSYAVLLALGLSKALAQSAAPQAANATPAAASAAADVDTDTLTLDPFTVTTEHEGYQAVDTLAGGRVRTKLIDTPASLSVVTKKFMQDLSINNAEDLLVYTNNTEVSGLTGNYSGLATRGAGISVSGPSEGTRLANPAGVNRARGLTAMDNTRNYMLSDIPWDGYNISRVDISRGPNSFLYGVGSPSGISNVSTKDATYKDEGSVEAHYGSFGSTRESLDYNKVVLPRELAIRLDLVNSDNQYQQKPAYNHSQREYGAVRYDPKFLSTPSASTKIQLNFEHGEVSSNNPRMVPPLDYITGYLKDSSASKTGYNPWTYLENSGANPAGTSAWTSHGSIGNQYQWGNGTQYYWEGATGQLVNAGQAGWSAPTVIDSTGKSVSANYGAGDVNNNIYHVHTVGYSDYAKSMNYAYLQSHNGVDGGDFRGAYKGTVNYLDKTLADPSVFDFYHKLIDGDNKHEWQRWNAYNINIVQSLFNNRLVIQGVIDHQKYKSGQQGLLNSRTPVIIMDLDSYLLSYPSWLPQAQSNPNLGRPLVFGDYSSATASEVTHDNYQVTAAYSLNAEDFLSKGLLSRILGKHELTALCSRYTTTNKDYSYKPYGIDPYYAKTYAGATKLSDNSMNWLAYLGPSLLGTSGAGADLSNLSKTLTPTAYQMRVYSSQWTAGSSVDPTSPWTFTLPNGSSKTLTQADNPANFKGYTTVPGTVLNAQSNIDQLYTGSSIREQRISSTAFLYQGHMWDDIVVPSVGVRWDETRQRGNVATQNTTTGLVSVVNDITDTGVKATTRSTSYGVALHLPREIKNRLPEGSDFSLFYFHGANETPKVRYAIDGSQLPNEKGKTDDYSAQLDIGGRFTMRVTYFKTQDSNAQASYGQPLGTNGWLIDSLPAWTLTMAACGLAPAQLGEANIPDGLKWNSWIYGWALDPSRRAVVDSIGNTLKTDFVQMFPQSYWDQYSSNVDVAAIKRGDWLHVLKGTDVPLPWNATGSHQIHGQWAVIDQNLESKGYELEATVRPLKNWDLTFNASKVSATQTSLGAAASRYLNGMAKLWLDSPLGKTAIWGGYSDYGAAKNMFMQNLWAPYLTQVALTGADQPELRKWHFNIISNYNFNRGALKGFNAGVAYRWDSKPIMGYGIHQATVYGEQAWIADVNQPLYGPSEKHVDLWVGYEHSLNKQIRWRLQLNLRNVGQGTHLEPISLEPDGTVAQSRIAQGTTYDMSLKFMF